MRSTMSRKGACWLNAFEARLWGSRFVINEDRLNNLSDSFFLNVRGKRYLPPIYAHLISLQQIERLTQLSK